jgi:hypothetical protein
LFSEEASFKLEEKWQEVFQGPEKLIQTFNKFEDFIDHQRLSFSIHKKTANLKEKLLGGNLREKGEFKVVGKVLKKIKGNEEDLFAFMSEFFGNSSDRMLGS